MQLFFFFKLNWVNKNQNQPYEACSHSSENEDFLFKAIENGYFSDQRQCNCPCWPCTLHSLAKTVHQAVFMRFSVDSHLCPCPWMFSPQSNMSKPLHAFMRELKKIPVEVKLWTCCEGKRLQPCNKNLAVTASQPVWTGWKRRRRRPGDNHIHGLRKGLTLGGLPPSNGLAGIQMVPCGWLYNRARMQQHISEGKQHKLFQ